jgi:4'-phosphopantetheinyl transferase
VIDWLVCLADDISLEIDRPPGFLSTAERETFAGLRFPKRRREWLLGRWTAKQLFRHSQAAYRDLPFDAISVGNDPDGAPCLSVEKGGRLEMSLSISHRDDRAFCALSSSLPPIVGADMERIETRDPAFVQDFFTADEAERVWACPAPARDTLVTVLWSAKEATLKAMRQGLRVDTRRVEIRHVAGIEPDPAKREATTRVTGAWPAPEAWHELGIYCALVGTAHLTAWWRPQGNYVLTLAALVPTDVPLSSDPRGKTA